MACARRLDRGQDALDPAVTMRWTRWPASVWIGRSGWEEYAPLTATWLEAQVRSWTGDLVAAGTAYQRLPGLEPPAVRLWFDLIARAGLERSRHGGIKGSFGGCAGVVVLDLAGRPASMGVRQGDILLSMPTRA